MAQIEWKKANWEAKNIAEKLTGCIGGPADVVEEMFRALERMVLVYECMTAVRRDDDALSRAVAAIAKAKGVVAEREREQWRAWKAGQK